MPHFRSILVPMKLGIIGEEMVATAVKLAREHGAQVEALYVIRVPIELALDAEMAEEEARAAASLDEARALGEENARRGAHEHGPRARDRPRDRRPRARGRAPT